MKFELKKEKIPQIIERYLIEITLGVSITLAGLLITSETEKMLLLVVAIMLFAGIIIVNVVEFYSSQIVGVEIGKEAVEFIFQKANKRNKVALPFHRMTVRLDKIINYKGHFIGINLIIQDKIKGIYWLISDKKWGYWEMEQMYFALKDKTNDPPSDDEQEALKQLQIMSRSKY